MRDGSPMYCYRSVKELSLSFLDFADVETTKDL